MEHQHTRAVGVPARLLLGVVLALGVFIMHTVGHPSEGPGSHMSTAPHAVDIHADDTASLHTEQDAGTHPGSLSVADSPVHSPGMGMDMASLCLAVLGAWALASLLYAAFTAWREPMSHLATRVLALVRPDPPPRPPDLAQLSILRI